MKTSIQYRVCWVILLATLLAGVQRAEMACAADDPEGVAVTSAGKAFTKAFNGGDVETVVAMFQPSAGELIDEAGNSHQGEKAVKELFTAYFKKFPGANLELQTDSIRVIGNLAIEEGTRYLSAKETAPAQVRYVTVWTKEGGKWLIASTRESYDEPAPQPADRLAELAWLVGDWVSEDAEAAVRITYRWDEAGNFLLGDFESTRGGKPMMKSTQRIGWDPLSGKVRSWLFDADGGFAEGSWTLVEDGWVIKSDATMPDGTVGSATVSILPKGKDQFTMQGTERIVGDQRVDDFEITISRAPPSPKKVEVKPAPAPGTKPTVPGSRLPVVPSRPIQGK